jgi:hypothetical protein
MFITTDISAAWTSPDSALIAAGGDRSVAGLLQLAGRNADKFCYLHGRPHASRTPPPDLLFAQLCGRILADCVTGRVPAAGIVIMMGPRWLELVRRRRAVGRLRGRAELAGNPNVDLRVVVVEGIIVCAMRICSSRCHGV